MSQKPSKGSAGGKRGREYGKRCTRAYGGEGRLPGAGEGTEDWKEKEKQQYLGGLRRLSEKGIAIYVDGRVSGPPEWEKLFEIRDDNMFYMGDYVQAESGGLKEVRFDKVYLSREDLKKPEE